MFTYWICAYVSWLTEFTPQNTAVKAVGCEGEEKCENFKDYLYEREHHFVQGTKLYFSVKALLKCYLVFT